MRNRLILLITTFGIAIVAVACGRATQEQIDAALGITPTVTLSAEQIATGTAQAAAGEQTRAAGLASLDDPNNGSPVAFAEVGDVVQGKLQFQLRCLNCHKVSGSGSAAALAGPGNPSTKYSDQQFVDLIRTGEGHAKPPGPLTTVTISERQLINIIAYIRSQSN